MPKNANRTPAQKKSKQVRKSPKADPEFVDRSSLCGHRTQAKSAKPKTNRAAATRANSSPVDTVHLMIDSMNRRTLQNSATLRVVMSSTRQVETPSMWNLLPTQTEGRRERITKSGSGFGERGCAVRGPCCLPVNGIASGGALFAPAGWHAACPVHSSDRRGLPGLAGGGGADRDRARGWAFCLGRDRFADGRESAVGEFQRAGGRASLGVRVGEGRLGRP